jgi:hypothetical protein
MGSVIAVGSGSRRSPARLPARVLIWGAASLSAATLLGACSSPARVLGAPPKQDCTLVADVLSDGPDPGADPVGYAEAQVLPLDQLTISQANLRATVKNLAAAYRSYSSSTGVLQAQAKARVTKAERAVNALCPGAAP